MHRVFVSGSVQHFIVPWSVYGTRASFFWYQALCPVLIQRRFVPGSVDVFYDACSFIHMWSRYPSPQVCLHFCWQRCHLCRQSVCYFRGKCCYLWIYGVNAAIYGGNSGMYARNAAILAGVDAVYSSKAACDAARC
eukprot:791967-Rhodomonas_salina.1